jgi:hypothetical protein
MRNTQVADYTHLSNLIGGEVIRIKERTPEGWPQVEAYDRLLEYLAKEQLAVLEEKVALLRLLRTHDDDLPIG